LPSSQSEIGEPSATRPTLRPGVFAPSDFDALKTARADAERAQTTRLLQNRHGLVKNFCSRLFCWTGFFTAPPPPIVTPIRRVGYVELLHKKIFVAVTTYRESAGKDPIIHI
jgi:hypothetical protein